MRERKEGGRERERESKCIGLLKKGKGVLRERERDQVQWNERHSQG
jgi:hypothetical protein